MIKLSGIFARFDEEAGSYVFTKLGSAAIIVAIVILMVIAAYIAGRKQIKISIRELAVSAILIALAFVTSNIKLFEAPMGGSVTLFSMLFICLIGYWYGIRIGLLAGLTYGFLQLIVDPYVISLPQMLIDYMFSFSALGLAGIGHHLDKKLDFKIFELGGLQIGYVIGLLGRYFFAFLSGYVFFGEWAPKSMGPVVYSLAYNGSYLGIEGGITLMVLLIAPVSKALKVAKNMVNPEK